MGMYTELILGAQLKKDTPSYIIEAFDYVINKDDSAEISDEAKTFIDEYSLYTLFYCTSYYFGVIDSTRSFRYDSIAGQWCISTRANLKNGGRIEKFLEFIKDYIEDGSGPTNIFAYVQYEESDFPTLWTPSGKYSYDASGFEEYYNKQVNEYYSLFNKLYYGICKDFAITPEILEQYGLTADTYTQHDGLRIGLEEMLKRMTASQDENYKALMERMHDQNDEIFSLQQENASLNYRLTLLQEKLDRLNKKEVQ